MYEKSIPTMAYVFIGITSLVITYSHIMQETNEVENDFVPEDIEETSPEENPEKSPEVIPNKSIEESPDKPPEEIQVNPSEVNQEKLPEENSEKPPEYNNTDTPIAIAQPLYSTQKNIGGKKSKKRKNKITGGKKSKNIGTRKPRKH